MGQNIKLRLQNVTVKIIVRYNSITGHSVKEYRTHQVDQRFPNRVRGPLKVRDDLTGDTWLRPDKSINQRLSRLAKFPGKSLQ